MPLFFERFVLAVLVGALVTGIFVNPLKFDNWQRVSLAIAIIAAAFFISHTLEKTRAKDEVVDIPEATLGVPPPSAAPPQGKRSYTDKTVRDLLQFYDGKTMLQADSLISPFKGEWIKVTAKVVQLIPDQSGITAVLESRPTDIVNARFDKRWETPLRRLSAGDTIKLRGRIANTQNGQQFYMEKCELLK
jgi:hypothetical protein